MAKKFKQFLNYFLNYHLVISSNFSHTRTIASALVSSIHAYALSDAHHHLDDGHALRLCAMDIKV
jgi:hypothetical protein